MTMTIPNQTSDFPSDQHFKIWDNVVPPIPYIFEYFDSVWFTILNIIIFIFCFLGFLANGTVIWILGFHIKRNSFTIYILNLAVADLGVLIIQIFKHISLLLAIHTEIGLYLPFLIIFIYFIMYNTGQLLLITISIDRCVSVLFPIWHRCHRPPKLSKVICAILWVFSFTLFGSQCLTVISYGFLLFQLILNGLICYPLMVISTLTLLVTIRFKQHQQNQRRVFKATLLTLLCFLAFRFPISLFSFIFYVLLTDPFSEEDPPESDLLLLLLIKLHSWLHVLLTLVAFSEICVTINSSINPILYFLAGRKKKDQHRTSMKILLQRVFRNEDDTRETEVQIQL